MVNLMNAAPNLTANLSATFRRIPKVACVGCCRVFSVSRLTVCPDDESRCEDCIQDLEDAWDLNENTDRMSDR